LWAPAHQRAPVLSTSYPARLFASAASAACGVLHPFETAAPVLFSFDFADLCSRRLCMNITFSLRDDHARSKAAKKIRKARQDGHVAELTGSPIVDGGTAVAKSVDTQLGC
jgi:hypothetical protein